MLLVTLLLSRLLLRLLLLALVGLLLALLLTVLLALVLVLVVCSGGALRNRVLVGTLSVIVVNRRVDGGKIRVHELLPRRRCDVHAVPGRAVHAVDGLVDEGVVDRVLRIGDREVHFEFGRSIVAECGELITTVLFNKTTATGRKLVIVDASMTELVRPAMYGSYHNIENITAKDDEVREKYTVVGTACESTDVFDENVTLRRTHRGDLLTIKSAGAYGMSMASRYNLHDLPGAVYSDEIK